MEKNTKDWFHTGRGNVSGDLAKSSSEILNQESEEAQEGMEAAPVKNKPVFATGEMPFHNGRGLGRGHSQ